MTNRLDRFFTTNPSSNPSNSRQSQNSSADSTPNSNQLTSTPSSQSPFTVSDYFDHRSISSSSVDSFHTAVSTFEGEEQSVGWDYQSLPSSPGEPSPIDRLDIEGFSEGRGIGNRQSSTYRSPSLIEGESESENNSSNRNSIQNPNTNSVLNSVMNQDRTTDSGDANLNSSQNSGNNNSGSDNSDRPSEASNNVSSSSPTIPRSRSLLSNPRYLPPIASSSSSSSSPSSSSISRRRNVLSSLTRLGKRHNSSNNGNNEVRSVPTSLPPLPPMQSEFTPSTRVSSVLPPNILLSSNPNPPNLSTPLSSNLPFSRRRRRADSSGSSGSSNNAYDVDNRHSEETSTIDTTDTSFSSSSYSRPKRRHRATNTFRKIRESVIGSFGESSTSGSSGSRSSSTTNLPSTAAHTSDSFIPVIDAISGVPPQSLNRLRSETTSGASDTSLYTDRPRTVYTPTTTPNPTPSSTPLSTLEPTPNLLANFTSTSPRLSRLPNRITNRFSNSPWGLGIGSPGINLSESRSTRPSSFVLSSLSQDDASTTSTSSGLSAPSGMYRRSSRRTMINSPPVPLPSPLSLLQNNDSASNPSIFDSTNSTSSALPDLPSLTSRRRSGAGIGRRNLTDGIYPRSSVSAAASASTSNSTLSSTSPEESDGSSFEGQAAMLARLLAVAASVTARSLVGPIRSSSGFVYGRSRNLQAQNGDSMDVEEGFNAFLDGLNNGLLESELSTAIESNGSNGTSSSNPNRPRRPQNFFRMFRFPPSNRSGEDNLIPVLIVGVRAVDSTEDVDNLSATGTDGHVGLALLDALASTGHHDVRTADEEGTTDSNTATTNTTTTATTDDTIPTPATPSTTPTTAGPSTASTSSTRPSIPIHEPTTNSIRNSTINSIYRNFFDGLHRRTSSSVTSDSLVNNLFEDTPRSNSHGHGHIHDHDHDHDFNNIYSSRSSSDWRRDSNSSGSTYRPTTSEPLNNQNSTMPASQPREVTRQSWIVYVVGGSYPENHPILLAPTLLADNPSYEDLLILENFLGQVKSPVATKEEILSSGGVLTVGGSGPESVEVLPDDRCLVCLSNYQQLEECRKLHKCGHMFHRDCIDQWLLTGRNSCPLCRTEGVKSKSLAEKHRPSTVAPELPIS